MIDQPITEQELDEIEALCNAATPGPWTADDYGDMIWAADPYGHGLMHVFDVRGWGHLTGDGTCRFSEDKAIAIQEANGAFAAHSRADVPRLVAEIRRLRAELQNAEPVVRCRECRNSSRIASDITDRPRHCWSGRGVRTGDGFSRVKQDGYCDEGERMDATRAAAEQDGTP